MIKKEMLETIENHWEKMKEDIDLHVPKEEVFKVNLLLDSMENNWSVIKAILDCKDEVDDDNFDEEEMIKSIDVHYTIKIVKYLLKFLDKCESDGNEKKFYDGDLITSYGTDYEEPKSEKFIMKYLKKRGIDIVINKPSNVSTSRVVYVNFNNAHINDVRKVLNEIPIKILDAKW